MGPHADDMLAANPQVGYLINVLRGVDDPAVRDAKGIHARDCSGNRPACHGTLGVRSFSAARCCK